MKNKFQFFKKQDKEASQRKLSGHQVEKRYCPGQNGTSGHFNLLEMLLSS